VPIFVRKSQIKKSFFIFADTFIKNQILASFMANKNNILSLLAMDKIMKKAGAYRVSDEAKEALRDVLEELGDKISKKADELSKHAGRCTIKAVDIHVAAK
jgi:histone H3/H4